MLIRVAEDDQAVNRLQPPAAFDERGREPVEQFRMTGTFSLQSEIIGRLDEADSEMLLPQPIDDDSRGERMIG